MFFLTCLRRERRRWMHWAARVASGTALAAVAVLVTACGGGGNAAGPGVANGASSAASASSPAGASPLALARCMRAHGVADFPDPDSSGSFDLHGGPGSDLDPNNATYQAAAQACRSLGRAPANKSGPHLSPQQRAAMLQYSQCMRAHGITNFPDPNNDGDIAIQGNIDRHTPQFQAAADACRHYLPAGTGMRGTL